MVGEEPVGKEFDVVVVGGRCAGSPLAALLARGGLSVALVEQATFPRDTLSTHTFQSPALAFLDRLGVLSAVRATGAPVVNHLDIRQEEFRARMPWPREVQRTHRGADPKKAAVPSDNRFGVEVEIQSAFSCFQYSRPKCRD